MLRRIGVQSLEQALDRVVEPARTFQHVDHEQLAQLLKDHLLAPLPALTATLSFRDTLTLGLSILTVPLGNTWSRFLLLSSLSLSTM